MHNRFSFLALTANCHRRSGDIESNRGIEAGNSAQSAQSIGLTLSRMLTQHRTSLSPTLSNFAHFFSRISSPPPPASVCPPQVVRKGHLQIQIAAMRKGTSSLEPKMANKK